MKNIRSVQRYKRSIPVMMLVAATCLPGCKKLIEVDLPVDRITNKTVFSSTATAVAVMNGVYSVLGSGGPFVGEAGVSIRSALMSDELNAIVNPLDWEYLNKYSAIDGWNNWISSYKEAIYGVNSILENIAASSIPERPKQILSGEAKFSRAWLYFNLTNFYGDVPLVLTTDIRINASIARTPQEQVYQQIEQDLVDAQQLLTDEYLDKDLVIVSEDRIRPNKAAATALLARVYLYRKKWKEAEIAATKAISDPQLELLSDPDQVFLKNSRESIWQLQPNSLDPDGKNTPDGRSLINTYGGGYPAYSPSQQLLQAFESGDQRRNKWITVSQSGPLIIYKYKEGWGTTIVKEYTTVLRLAEQYLIRAEARAQLNNLTGPNSAASDLNAIRNRAGLPNTNAVTQGGLLAAIEKERQVELFLEWGERWFNLKRLGKIDAVMSIVTPLKGGTWEPYKALLAIPSIEFSYNPALRGHQNPGYQELP